MSTLYLIKEIEETDEDGEVKKKLKVLPQETVPGAARVDLHVHSSGSGYIIPNPLTRWLGVRECYTKPETVYYWTKKHPLKSRRMDFVTISDHDVISTAEDFRERHPENFFTSCEYTVRARKSFIHVGVVGLEYAGETQRPRSRKEVEELHKDLSRIRHHSWQKFFEYCDQVGLVYVTNHLGLIMSSDPKTQLGGKQAYEIAKASKYLEINGDCQLENLIAIELAQKLPKHIVAGSDAHTWRSLGHQYTVTTVPARTPYEFIRALKEGNVGIGSKFPVRVQKPSPPDVMMRAFNGRPFILFQDAVIGHSGYLSRDYIPEEGLGKLAEMASQHDVKKVFFLGRKKKEESLQEILTRNKENEKEEDRIFYPRKLLATGAFFGIPLAAGTVTGYAASSLVIGSGVGTMAGGIILGAALIFSSVISWNEKRNFAYRARDLYREIQNCMAKENEKNLNRAQELGHIVKSLVEGNYTPNELEALVTRLRTISQDIPEIMKCIEDSKNDTTKMYQLKDLRIPHDLVGFPGWLGKLLQGDYDLGKRDLLDLAEVMQEPVTPEQTTELSPESNPALQAQEIKAEGIPETVKEKKIK